MRAGTPARQYCMAVRTGRWSLASNAQPPNATEAHPATHDADSSNDQCTKVHWSLLESSVAAWITAETTDGFRGVRWISVDDVNGARAAPRVPRYRAARSVRPCSSIRQHHTQLLLRSRVPASPAVHSTVLPCSAVLCTALCARTLHCRRQAGCIGRAVRTQQCALHDRVCTLQRTRVYCVLYTEV